MKSLTELKAEYGKVRAKQNKVFEKRAELTKDLDKESFDLSREASKLQYEIKRLEDGIKKSNRVKNYMNLVLEWDNGRKFDTRKDKYGDLLNLLFNNGLPDNMEMRG